MHENPYKKDVGRGRRGWDFNKETVLQNVHKAEDGCWYWTGNWNSFNGYGKIMVKRKYLKAHRFSYIVFKGEIPDGLKVLHSCDNKLCVNPDHLEAGTQKQNILDMYKRKRRVPYVFRVKRGSEVKLSKLNEEKALKIKQLLSDNKSVREICELFGVKESTIRAIKKGQTWKHVSFAGEQGK